jgi:hypothetical protein
MATKKYRPYLTLVELELLKHLTSKDTNVVSQGVHKYLSKYISDIRAGYRTENHTLKPGIEERLGFTQKEPTEDDIRKAEVALAKSFADWSEESSNSTPRQEIDRSS